MRGPERDANGSRRRDGCFEEREAKLQVLKDHIHRAINRGGTFSDDDLAAILTAQRNQKRNSS